MWKNRSVTSTCKTPKGGLGALKVTLKKVKFLTPYLSGFFYIALLCPNSVVSQREHIEKYKGIIMIKGYRNLGCAVKVLPFYGKKLFRNFRSKDRGERVFSTFDFLSDSHVSCPSCHGLQARQSKRDEKMMK